MTASARSSEDLLTRDEAAQWLRVDAGTLRNWATRGRGPRFSRLIGRVVYRREDLEEFVAAHLVETDPGGDAA